MSKELINSHYYIVSTLVILAATGIFFLQYERQKPTVKDFVTLAVLSAVAVVSRAAFAMVPHFKPITGIIISAGRIWQRGRFFCRSHQCICQQFHLRTGTMDTMADVCLWNRRSLCRFLKKA